MNTIEDRTDEPDIPLELRGDGKEIGKCETRVEVGRAVKPDDNSEEAILFERTLDITYETGNGRSTSSRQWTKRT